MTAGDLDLAPHAGEAAAWDALVETAPAANLLQTWAWGAAKAATGPWRVERLVFRAGETVVGLAQVLRRDLPLGLGCGLAWVSRGPLALVPGHEGAMLALLRRHYAEARGAYLRVAPAWGDGTPAPRDFVAVAPGWASAALDLAPDEAALRASLRANWKGALVKAERAGLAVAVGADEAAFETFVAAYRRFLGAGRFATSVTPDLLIALQRALPPARRLTAVLVRTVDTLLAAALIARVGGTAEYLAGLTEPAGRQAGAGQFALWTAVCAARAAGARRFDLGGLDPIATPEGIRQFNAGLGGAPYRLAPELEACTGMRARLVRWWVERARAPAAGGS